MGRGDGGATVQAAVVRLGYREAYASRSPMAALGLPMTGSQPPVDGRASKRGVSLFAAAMAAFGSRASLDGSATGWSVNCWQTSVEWMIWERRLESVISGLSQTS